MNRRAEQQWADEQNSRRADGQMSRIAEEQMGR
jgi:hypothetical protein